MAYIHTEELLILTTIFSSFSLPLSAQTLVSSVRCCCVYIQGNGARTNWLFFLLRRRLFGTNVMQHATRLSPLTSFRNVLCVSSSKRINSFITITSPVSLWVTCYRTEPSRWATHRYTNSSTPASASYFETATFWTTSVWLHTFCQVLTQPVCLCVCVSDLNGLSEAALPQHLSVDEVRRAEDAVRPVGHDAERLRSIDVLPLGDGGGCVAGAWWFVNAVASPGG